MGNYISQDQPKEFRPWSWVDILFDEASTLWDDMPRISLERIVTIESVCNKILRVNGYIRLEQVIEMLGLPSIGEKGHKLGWMYEDGKNCVTFGIFARDAKRFLDEEEQCIWLTMNCTGYISRRYA